MDGCVRPLLVTEANHALLLKNQVIFVIAEILTQYATHEIKRFCACRTFCLK